SGTTCASSKAMGCCSATAPATPIVSPPKGFRSRSSSCSSTNACAARAPIAASTTAPTPSTSRPANSKPPTTAPTKQSNRSSIYSPPHLSAAIVELFLSTILPRRIYMGKCGRVPLAAEGQECLGARLSNSQQAEVLEFYCRMAHQAGVIQQLCPVGCIILSLSELLGGAPSARISGSDSRIGRNESAQSAN